VILLVKCPKCGGLYKLAKCDYEQYGIIVRNIPCFRCSKCGDEVFSPEQVKLIREKIEQFSPQIKMTRKISKAGKRPAIYLPERIAEALGLGSGDEVTIYLEGKKRIVIEPL
jgi:hypothetical protein